MNIEKLLQDKAKAEGEVARLTREVEHFRRNCRHTWEPIKYVPEHQEGYTNPGDPPGTMGIDWRGPFYIAGKTIKRWERICTLCKLVQTTERTHRVDVYGRIAGTSSTVEEPLF